MEEKKIAEPAQCVFDLYNLKFGMVKDEINNLRDESESGQSSFMNAKSISKAGAESVELFFDHEGRLWMAKARYLVNSPAEAEEMLEKMSQDYRFQTPSARIAFDLEDGEGGRQVLSVRYTEANMKRVYLHHMMAVGAAKLAKTEEAEKAIKDKEEEEYIPSGPLIF